MRPHLLALVLALSGLPSGSAAGYTVRQDYRAYASIIGENVISIANCGVSASGIGVNAYQFNGLGVWGGLGDTLIDGGEDVRFSFPPGGGSSSVQYFVSSAGNVDGDGLVGEHFLEAFGPTGTSLGVVARSGTGTVDATDLFGGASIGSILVTAQADTLRVAWVDYALHAGQSALVRLTSLYDRTVTSFEHCGLTVTSSTGAVGVTQDEGVSARTSPTDGWIDPGEWVEVAFDGPAHVSYVVDGLDDDGNFQEGEHFVEGFDAAGASLGIRAAVESLVALSDPGYFGDEPLSRIVVTGSDRIVIARITVPEPAAAALAAVAALTLLARCRPLH
jgi:hypothetical protein